MGSTNMHQRAQRLRGAGSAIGVQCDLGLTELARLGVEVVVLDSLPPSSPLRSSPLKERVEDRGLPGPVRPEHHNEIDIRTYGLNP